MKSEKGISQTPPSCVRCKKIIWGSEAGYFFLNPVTDKFDLYCETCNYALTSGMNTV